MKKTSMFLLWAGAAISISEIYTGGLLAPLGFGKALIVILAGHALGTGLLALGGHVSFLRKRNAMDSAAWALGSAGGKIAAFFNVAQLTGWTVVMIVQASGAVAALFPSLRTGPAGIPVSAGVSLALGIIVLVWALIFGTPAQWINSAAVILLFALSGILLWELSGRSGIPGGAAGVLPASSLSVALGLELSIAMPVSWLPLIGDYSSTCKKGSAAVLMPFAGYFLASTAMYLFGLLAALKSGGDFFAFIAESRFRAAAAAVIVLSTMTTAFLDLYSAAVSSRQFFKTKNPRTPVLVIGILATAASAFFPVEKYSSLLTNFLSLIGMIFVPVYGVVFADFFLKRPRFPSALNVRGFIAAAAGMIVYRFFTVHETGVPSLFCLAFVCAVYIPLTLFKGETS
jgi:putative hydroxymethylpyrimidine transporter CytX